MHGVPHYIIRKCASKLFPMQVSLSPKQSTLAKIPPNWVLSGPSRGPRKWRYQNFGVPSPRLRPFLKKKILEFLEQKKFLENSQEKLLLEFLENNFSRISIKGRSLKSTLGPPNKVLSVPKASSWTPHCTPSRNPKIKFGTPQ
jgi:hypothetical protein